jgi:hypothetical protein
MSKKQESGRPSGAAPQAERRRARLALAGLAVVLALSAMLRWRLLDVPLERDEGEYAYAGQIVLSGGAPYLELYNMKLPGIYLVYAGTLALLGETARGIHLGLLAASLLSTTLVFALGRRLVGPLGALGAAALFALLAEGTPVLGPWANAEHFVLPFALGGLVLLEPALRSGAGRAAPSRLVLAGALLGSAVLVKQHAAAFALCAAAWILAAPGALAARRESARRLALLAAGGLVPFALVAGWLAAKGALGRAWFWCVVYAREYVDQVPLAEAPRAFWFNARPILAGASAAWILAAAGLALALATPRARSSRALLLLALASALAIAPGFFFRQHYFVLLLPAAALLAGRALEAAAARPAPLGPALAGLALAAALGEALWRGRQAYLAWTPEQVVRFTYQYNPFAESVEVGWLVRELCPPGGRVAILGSEPQILFYARRRSATGFVYMYPLMERHEHAARMQRELIAEIEAADPEVLVQVGIPGSWLYRPGVSAPHVMEWSQGFAERYRLVALWEIGLERSKLWQGAELASLRRRPQLSIEVLRRAREGPR